MTDPGERSSNCGRTWSPVLGGGAFHQSFFFLKCYVQFVCCSPLAPPKRPLLFPPCFHCFPTLLVVVIGPVSRMTQQFDGRFALVIAPVGKISRYGVGSNVLSKTRGGTGLRYGPISSRKTHVASLRRRNRWRISATGTTNVGDTLSEWSQE